MRRIQAKVKHLMTEIMNVDQQSLDEHAKDIAEATKSESTKTAYQTDMRKFGEWADEFGHDVNPAEEDCVAAYAIWLSKIGRKPSTIRRALVSIAQWHKLKGYDNPVTTRVRELNKGIRRLSGERRRRARPVTWIVLNRLFRHIPESTAIGIRDRALLLVGFAGAMRRSEIVAMNVEDCEFVDEGLVISQRRSKTNQFGDIRKLAIPYIDVPGRCAVKALRRLIEYNQLETGPIFYALGVQGTKMFITQPTRRLRAAYVSHVIKRYADRAGYPPEQFSGHSLRAGFATSASKAGLTSSVIMTHTGHRSHLTMMEYVRDGRKFNSHPLTSIVNAFPCRTTQPQGSILLTKNQTSVDEAIHQVEAEDPEGD